MHLLNAGFDFDVATPTGQPACLEEWALPLKDTAFLQVYETHKSKFETPKSLADLVNSSADNTAPLNNSYAAFFLPGGHGAMLGLPDNEHVAKVIAYCHEQDCYLMSICHGPAALLAAAAGEKETDQHPYKGYQLACFPDSVDKQTPMIGYIPGAMPWYFGEKLLQQGLVIVNHSADDTVVSDRKLLTGASPKAGQKLGKLAAEKLLEEFATSTS